MSDATPEQVPPPAAPGDSPIAPGTDDLALDSPVEDDDGPLGASAARALGERLHDAAERGASDDDEPGEVNDGKLEPGEGEPPDADTEPGRLAICPFCGEGTVDADKLLEALPGIVAALEPFKQYEGYETCEACDGWGTVLTGARAGDATVAPCPRCNGAGYVARGGNATTPGEPPATPPPAAPPAASFVDPMRLSPEQGGAAPAVGMAWNAQIGQWEYPIAAA